MFIFRSKVSTTKTGRHRGLRSGAAAVVLGAVLAGTAGAPASQAAAGLSAAASTAPSAQGSLTLGLGDVLDSLLGSSTTPSPSPSAGSGESSPSPSHGSSPEPSDPEPSDPEPSRPRAQRSRTHGPAHQYPTAVEHPAREGCAARRAAGPRRAARRPGSGSSRRRRIRRVCPHRAGPSGRHRAARPPTRPPIHSPAPQCRPRATVPARRRRPRSRPHRTRPRRVQTQPAGPRHRLRPRATPATPPSRQPRRWNRPAVPAGRLGHRPGGALARRRRRGPPDAPELTGPASRGRAPASRAPHVK